MRNGRHIALSLAVLAALALAAQQGYAGDLPSSGRTAPALTTDSTLGDGRPPSPGPTNPNGPLM